MAPPLLGLLSSCSFLSKGRPACSGAVNTMVSKSVVKPQVVEFVGWLPTTTRLAGSP